MASRYPDCDPEKDWETQSETDSEEESTDGGKYYFNNTSQNQEDVGEMKLCTKLYQLF